MGGEGEFRYEVGGDGGAACGEVSQVAKVCWVQSVRTQSQKREICVLYFGKSWDSNTTYVWSVNIP